MTSSGMILLAALGATSATAETAVKSVAVLEIAPKGGITAEQAQALADMVANLIRAAGVEKVIGTADVLAALALEQKKQLLGCSDHACLADVGGALGVPWVVSGNVSRFGESWVVNLSLIDARRVEVARGVTRTVRGGEEALVDALPDAVRELVTGVSGLHAGGGILFLRERAGAFPLSLSLGASATIPPHRSNEDTNPNDYAQLSPLSELYAAFDAKLFAGYALWDWLTVGLRLILLTGGDVKRRDRVFVAVDGGVEVQGTLPLSHFFSPTFLVGAGVGRAWDFEKGAGDDDYDGGLFRLDIGFGGQFRLSRRWFIATEVVATETVFFGIHDRTDRRLNSQMLGTSINLLGTVGLEL
jgi:hypothetical protein